MQFYVSAQTCSKFEGGSRKEAVNLDFAAPCLKVSNVADKEMSQILIEIW